MPVTISGVAVLVDYAAAVEAWTEQKYIYLQPSQDGFLFNRAASGTWVSWEGDADLEDTYPGAIAVPINMATGAWSVSVPYSDTECQFVGAVGPATPPLKWNIIDENVVSGKKVYYGETLSATMGAAKTLRELLNLGTPWQIGSTSYTGYPYGTERIASVAFAAGVSSAAATWASIGTVSWRCLGMSLRTDDTGITGCKILTGSETDVGCTVELSAAPAAGKTAQVDLVVRP